MDAANREMIMKKIFTYIAALAALLTASCNSVEFEGNSWDDGTLTISLSAADLDTKADAQTTAEATIDHFDYFFFANSDGTGLITSNRVTGTSISFDTTSDTYKNLAGKSYLYVIANYPEAIPASATTLEALLALPVKVAITSHPSTPFVMDSYDADKSSVLIELKPAAKNEARTQVVKMRRIAAKFVVNITIPASVTSADNTIWKPTTTTKDFYMYMVNSFIDSQATTIAGTPTDIAEIVDPTKFYTYGHKHVDMIRTDDLHWTSADYYSYPVTFTTDNQKAPYFKIQMPWVNVVNANQPATGSNIGAMGTHMFYYKVMLPEITEITRNTLYTLNVTLDKVGGTQEDYVIVTDTNLMVTNWLSPSGQFTGYYSARFLDTARDIYYIYGDDSTIIPVTSSHPISVVVNDAYKTTYNVTNGSEVTTHLSTTSYSATANGKASITLEHELDNRISITQNGQQVKNDSFDYTPITFEVTLTHQDGKQPHPKNITIIQYPPIYVYREQSNGYTYVNSYSNNSISGGRHSSSNAYNSRGNNSGSNGNDQVGTMNYLGSQSSANNNNSQYVVTVSVLPEDYKVAGTAPVIGDPRGGTLRYNYLGYSASGDNGTVNRTIQANYDNISPTSQYVIAPQIRIASSWGATDTIQSYDRAEERCAAYQENGYPAGRWRVPTVSEIDFLIKLSEYQYIPALFTCGARTGYYLGYWSNGPSAYAGREYSTTKPFEVGTPTNASNNRVTINNVTFDLVVRCVYDQWYWGDDKYNSNGQKITNQMTGTNANAATQWIGYIY